MKITLTVDRDREEKAPKRWPSWQDGTAPPGVHNFTLDAGLPKGIGQALHIWLKTRHANPTDAPDYEQLLNLLREGQKVVTADILKGGDGLNADLPIES